MISARPDTPRLDVVLCVDHGFTLPLAVTLASLERVSGAASTAHVLHPGLPASSRQRVEQGLTRVRVDWIDVDDAQVRGAHHSTFLSSASLYRLLIADLLPDRLDRVLYLDADTVLLESPSSLAAQDLEGYALGAVREAQSPWAAGPLGPPWRELGLDPASPYFNSGVMLIDLGRWRELEVGSRCLELLRRVRPRWGDQDALNTVLEQDWLELPRRWNLQSADARGEAAAWALWPDDVERALGDPAVVHYTDRDKPWHAGTRHPLAPQWYAHLDRTAWAGWRPALPRRGIVDRWGRAALRALRELRARRAAPVLPR
ncbi:glycosyltransferase family 8 protein [Microbacterium album]|uniref:General stress protein A n=1 Tax=Microbacterium album TaxID=2053191 RepID=A0A917MMN4_9MICO|nr:glycosyltransferase family 8 protein [Microbacterium album]GGH49039.1 general stress protein A [Microbacterium album]